MIHSLSTPGQLPCSVNDLLATPSDLQVAPLLGPSKGSHKGASLLTQEMGGLGSIVAIGLNGHL